MNNELKLNRNEKKNKMIKILLLIEVYSITFSVVTSTRGPNLRPSSFTVKRDKMNFIGNIYM
jgi:hypothetical protein